MMAEKAKMKVKLISFGYKHGAPQDANYVWDVRFLPNPYWEEELRPKTGLDNEVSDYVVGSTEGHDFLKLLKPMLYYLVQQNIAADKEDLLLAVGCTGGRHRSVAVIDVIGDMLQMLNVELQVEHRDIEKDD